MAINNKKSFLIKKTFPENVNIIYLSCELITSWNRKSHKIWKAEPNEIDSILKLFYGAIQL